MGTDSANECIRWAARDTSGVLSPYKFSRRTPGSDDVWINVKYCGVCYADIVWTRNYHGDSKYPVVPGHEIVGVVREVGSNVDRFKVGDHIGVGTYVDSCRSCEYCDDWDETYCSSGSIHAFNDIGIDGIVTKGGYSNHVVVHERYCYTIPESYPLEKAAPLLCAGVAVYAPMIRHNMNQPGKSLGLIGLGGLGHMAVKFGKAFGPKVIVLSTSESKRSVAQNLLGADDFVVSSDEQKMKALAGTLDFIVDAASGDHPFDPYMSLLKTRGIFVLVGAPSEVKLNPMGLLFGMKTLSGSLVGGTKITQHMLEFCASEKIYPDVEVVAIEKVNEALERLLKNDVKFRFVIDIENSLK